MDTKMPMDASVLRLETPEECEQFAENVRGKYPDLARQARQRGIELRAAAHGAKTAAEREALEAIYAYEEALFSKHGKRVRAQYTRRKMDKDGIIAAIEHAVKQQHDPTGFVTLKEMGLEHLSFESVVVRHPEAFSSEALKHAEKRLAGAITTQENVDG